MRPRVVFLVLLALLPARPAAVAGERTRPQPRVRLDPVTRTIVMRPPAQALTGGTSSPAVLMEKFVVTEQNRIPGETALSWRERRPAPHLGLLSAAAGGYLLKTNVGSARLEVGAWGWLPWNDVMWEDLKSFPKQKTRVDFDVARLHF